MASQATPACIGDKAPQRETSYFHWEGDRTKLFPNPNPKRQRTLPLPLKDKCPAPHDGFKKVEKRIVHLAKDVETAHILVGEGADLPQEMRAMASRIDAGGKGLALFKYLTIFNKIANMSRIASLMRKATDGPSRRRVMANALREMADCLERFAIYCLKEDVDQEKFSSDIKGLMEEVKGRTQQCRCGKTLRSEVSAVMLRKLKEKVGVLENMTVVFQDVTKKKGRRIAAAKAVGGCAK